MELHMSSKMNISDMSQECCSYMKIKQFLAERLCQQQIELDSLKAKVKYYIAKDVENQNLIYKLMNQLNYLKKKDRSFSLCSEEAFSQEIDEEQTNKKTPIPNTQNVEDLIDEVNKLTTDKYILFNELNELVMGLKKCDLSKLNQSLLKNKDFEKEEMPIVCGLKYNILSADSQLSQIVKVDQKRHMETINTEHIEYYDKIVKEAEKSFKEILETKLHICNIP